MTNVKITLPDKRKRYREGCVYTLQDWEAARLIRQGRAVKCDVIGVEANAVGQTGDKDN